MGKAVIRAIDKFVAGVDVGGTFTDVAVTDGRQMWRAKSPSTHGEVGKGVLSALGVAAGLAGLRLEDLLGSLTWLGLGTTAVTNVIAEQHGSRVGLITTAGFEDELNLARGIRFSIDGPVLAPAQMVSRRAISGVSERIGPNGDVLQPLDPAEAVAAVTRLTGRSIIDTLVVSFVNAYRNPSHEQSAAAAIRERFPDLHVVSAASLGSSFGFLSRTVFAVMNAFVDTAFLGLDELIANLEGRGLRVPLRLVDATGGMVSVATARTVPLTLIQSGPAAGVAAAAITGAQHDIFRVLACDVGGTSFDISVIDDARPRRRSNADVMRLPTGLSVVDVESIGSGGGSIAWMDARGMLRVGPRSAGSKPGPACYGWGGREPTVTDALVVLNYIDPAQFLGGRMGLDAAAAYDACAALGDSLGLSAIETAWGIRRIALADMTRVAQTLLNRRGLNAADYTLLSYGGCGGLFNIEIAKTLGITAAIIPEAAPVFSAFGAATAPLRREVARAVVRPLPLDGAAISQTLSELEGEIVRSMTEDGIPSTYQTITYEAAMRFKRQPSEVVVTLQCGLGPVDMLTALEREFEATYIRQYGASSLMLGAPKELVTLRAIGRGPNREFTNATAGSAACTDAESSRSRTVHTVPDGPAIAVHVMLGIDLVPGARVRGPALIDSPDTTIWLPAGTIAHVTNDRSLHIKIMDQPADLEEIR